MMPGRVRCSHYLWTVTVIAVLAARPCFADEDKPDDKVTIFLTPVKLGVILNFESGAEYCHLSSLISHYEFHYLLMINFKVNQIQ